VNISKYVVHKTLWIRTYRKPVKDRRAEAGMPAGAIDNRQVN